MTLEIELYQCSCEIACIYHVFITYYYSDTWPLEEKYMGLSQKSLYSIYVLECYFFN